MREDDRDFGENVDHAWDRSDPRSRGQVERDAD
jgi:hypothetical protein